MNDKELGHAPPDVLVDIAEGAVVEARWKEHVVRCEFCSKELRNLEEALAVAGAGMIVGLLAGSGIGYVVSIATNNNEWTPALGFLGVIEGAAVAVIYATCTLDAAKAARKRLHPALIGLTFFVFGAKFGAVGGLPGALVCGGLNAVFGASVAWFCRTKIRAAELEREFADQLGLGSRNT